MLRIGPNFNYGNVYFRGNQPEVNKQQAQGEEKVVQPQTEQPKAPVTRPLGGVITRPGVPRPVPPKTRPLGGLITPPGVPRPTPPKIQPDSKPTAGIIAPPQKELPEIPENPTVKNEAVIEEKPVAIQESAEETKNKEEQPVENKAEDVKIDDSVEKKEEAIENK